MEKYKFIMLQERKDLLPRAADWFHQKWGIAREAYVESMEKSLKNTTPVPSWYLVLDGERIIAGLGVIENDFHNRKDLTPNVCAVYVEEAYRSQGIAGKMLQLVCDDFTAKGCTTRRILTTKYRSLTIGATACPSPFSWGT